MPARSLGRVGETETVAPAVPHWPVEICLQGVEGWSVFLALHD